MIFPEEIDNQQFEVSFRGYNTREVDEFLNRIRMDIEEMANEQELLRKKVAAAELIAKDAKNSEEEFVASMQADRDAATATLEAAKTEGERIIREAKNAATGIMAEVRRRAGDISAESRKAVQHISEEANRKAAEITDKAEADAAALTDEASKNAAVLIAKAKEEANVITGAAKAAAEEKIYSARTEADNIVKAAKAHARAIEAEAKEKSAAMMEAAEKNTAICTKYMEEVRKAIDTVCREMDLELKNSAARIVLVGKRMAALKIEPPVKEEAAPAEVETQPEDVPVIEEPEVQIEEISDAPAAEAPAIEETPEPEIKKAPPVVQKPVKVREGGYFTEEYRQVMEELFGEDAVVSPTSSSEDDDTYDYLDKSATDNEDTVTSEYSEIANDGEDVLEVFSNSTVDRIYKSPTAEDIQDIMNEY